MPTAGPFPSRPREPVFNIPAVVVASIVALLAIHFARTWLSSPADFRLLVDFAFIPAVWTLNWDPQGVADVLREAGGSDAGEAPGRIAFARFVLSEADAAPWTWITYGLLHGSWTHVLLNGLWLAAFGTPVARRCGAVRFLALAAAAAVGGALAHWATHAHDVTPMIGASGAVSGMMAAAARFVFAPEPRSWPGRAETEPHLRPRQSLADLLRNRRALLFVGVWFGVNLVFGLAAVPLGIVEGGVAWEAHVGGFVVGLLGLPLLDPRGAAAPRAT